MPHSSANPDWQEVVETYQELRSFRKAAKRLGITKSGVEYILKAQGIQPLPRNRQGSENSQRQAIANSPDSPRNKARNFKLMHHLYVKKQLYPRQIGELLGLSSGTVRTCLIQCGIPLRPFSEVVKGVPKPHYRGDKHPFWRGGATFWRTECNWLLRRNFVRPVKERDNHTCRWCSSKIKTTVHHVRPFWVILEKVRKALPKNAQIKRIRDAIVAEHTLDDGITLCEVCHNRHHFEHGY